MSSVGFAPSVPELPAAGAQGASGLVIAVRVVIAIIVVAALLSPLWVALHATASLNQPPPPYFGVKAGTGVSQSSSAGAGHQTASLGGC